MAESKLMGFVRKTKNGNGVTVSVDTEAFKDAERYETKAGKEFVSMVISIAKLQQVINGEKEVTAANQITG